LINFFGDGKLIFCLGGGKADRQIQLPHPCSHHRAQAFQVHKLKAPAQWEEGTPNAMDLGDSPFTKNILKFLFLGKRQYPELCCPPKPFFFVYL